MFRFGCGNTVFGATVSPPSDWMGGDTCFFRKNILANLLGI